MIFLRWNEVSCPSRNGMLSISRHEVLKATGISTLLTNHQNALL
jgi:hypothetical protein